MVKYNSGPAAEAPNLDVHREGSLEQQIKSQPLGLTLKQSNSPLMLNNLGSPERPRSPMDDRVVLSDLDRGDTDLMGGNALGLMEEEDALDLMLSRGAKDDGLFSGGFADRVESRHAMDVY